MKRLICIICMLGFVDSTWAARNPYYKNWLTPERLERWQGLSQNMTVYDNYALIGEMYYLQREPWPESPKQILLKMTKTYEEMVKAERAGKPVIIPDFAIDACGEINAQLHEMVSWQNDPRFIAFQSSFNGQGMAARGLARIGEPAFETVIESLEKDQSQVTRTRDF